MRRKLASVLFLVATIGSCPTPPGIAQEPPPPVPAAASPTVASVREAHDHQKWREAFDGARAVLAGAGGNKVGLNEMNASWMRFIESESAFRLDLPEEALAAAKLCQQKLPPNAAVQQSWKRSIALAKGFPLLRLGRLDECSAVVDVYTSEYPEDKGHPRILDLRALLSARDAWSVWPEYGGRFKADPRLVRGLERIGSLIPAAFDRIRKRLGSLDLPMPRFVACIRDDMPYAADSSVWRIGNGWAAIVRFNSAWVVSGALPSIEVLSHEFLHGVRHLNAWNLSPPAWQEEGIAHWAEEDGEDRLWEMFLDHAIPRLGLGGVMHWVEHLASSPTWNERSETEQRLLGWLLFRFLERSQLPGVVQRYARTPPPLDGDPVAPFKDAFGATVLDAQADLRKSFPTWVREALDGVDELPVIGLLANSKEEEKFETAVAEFVKRHGKSRLLPHVLMATVAWRIEHHRVDEAASMLTELRGSHGADHSWRMSIDKAEVEVAAARGDHPATVRLGRQLLHDHPDLEENDVTRVNAIVDAAAKSMEKPTAQPAGGSDAAPK